MWGLIKSTIVPVVMGALGTIKKDMENFSYKIPGAINIHGLQKQFSFLQPTFSGGSCPSSRNPLCLSKSMVWTPMLKEKITRHYISISFFLIIIIFVNIFQTSCHLQVKNSNIKISKAQKVIIIIIIIIVISYMS